MKPPRISWSRRVLRFLRRLLTSRSHEAQVLYDDILYTSARTQSLEELLADLPQRICTAMELATFYVFLREKTDYVLQTANPATAFVLPASSSTVLRMRRDRKPALFVRDGDVQTPPDAWQLLATPSETEILNALQAQVLVPLEGRTGLMGLVTLSRPGQQTFTATEIRFLRDLGPQLGRGMETAQLVRSLSEQAVERERAHRELELARQVQERLLPGKLPPIRDVDAAAIYRAAGEVGGDYYDVFACGTTGGKASSGQPFCVAMGDVSGKGVPAALLMATLRAALHALLLEPPSGSVPAAPLGMTAVVKHLNALLYSGSASSRYATLFVAMYVPETGHFHYVNAGHNPPMLLRANGTITRLVIGGTVVGLLPEPAYECGAFRFEPGDVLLAFTDGVSEAMDPGGVEWGEERLQRVFQQTVQDPEKDAAGIAAAILHSLDRFANGAPQADDISLLLLRKMA